MPKLALVAALFLFVAFSSISPALAHSGGLNSEGCHINGKTGDYHCHDSGSSGSSSLAPAAPVQNFFGADGGVFANCSAARAAGAAPVRRADSGYGSHLDRDNDGIGCE